MMTPIQMQDVTLILIDDIRSVVEGIASQIDWESHGISVCGKAFDGEEGIRLIEQSKPDIIVTDIRMPKLNGLEMIRQVKKILPNCKVLLMTGFTDFEYAQEAIQLGAFDFIAKPFSLKQIEEAVLKAKLEVEQARGKEFELREMKQRVKESMPILKQEYFNLLVHHIPDECSARDRWDFLEIGLDPENFSVMLLEIDRFAEQSGQLSIREVEITRFALQNIVEETIAQYTRGIVFRETTNRFVVVMNTKSDELGSVIAEACHEHIGRYTRFTISIGIGGHVRPIQELAHSYKQAMAALSYHFYTGGNGVFSFRDVPGKRLLPSTFSRDKERELTLALQSGNRDLSLNILDDLFAEITGVHLLPEPEYGVSYYYELAFMMLRTFQEKIPYSELAELDSEMRNWGVAPSVSLKEMQRKLRILCVMGCGIIESGYQSEAMKVIDEAVRYIHSNLQEELSVNAVAKHVHLSGSYFANLFKKTTGSTLNQFVTQAKMERAKKLLLEDRQVQDIAEELGYVERRYFSDVFKKHTDKTPSEFKQAYMGKSGGNR